MTDDLLFDEPEPAAGPDVMGPVFTAAYETESACCGAPIVPGEDARGYQGGWIHADDTCEALARGDRPVETRSTMCPRCWTEHGAGQRECL